MAFSNCASLVVTEKATHAIDDDESNDPRRHKKRRTGSGPEEASTVSHDGKDTGESPGRQVEEELTLALSHEGSKPDPAMNGDRTLSNPQGDDTTENGATPAVTQDTMNPDVAAVISNIIDHSERVEEQYALNQQENAEGDSSESKDLVFIKANSHLKSQSLPILDNLVCFLTFIMAKQVAHANYVIFEVDPNPCLTRQIELPGNNIPRFRTRLGQWTGLLYNAVPVRSHQKGIFYEGAVPLAGGSGPHGASSG